MDIGKQEQVVFDCIIGIFRVTDDNIVTIEQRLNKMTYFYERQEIRERVNTLRENQNIFVGLNKRHPYVTPDDLLMCAQKAVERIVKVFKDINRDSYMNYVEERCEEYRYHYC